MNSAFPSTKLEALALAWLNAQDLSGLTPKDILAKYNEALEEMEQANKESKPKQSARY